ncbi:MAG: YdcF family protein, partial [Deltaproteobacteria bacterium]|nr:YdcF family protein [Deltaproteobacteria bacterium]
RYKEILLKKGVPEEAISFFSQGHVSTVEEAESLRKDLGGKPTKLLVVTSPYHTRRAKAIFGDVLPNADIRVVATPYENFDPQWWTDKNSAIAVVLETVQTIYYHLGGAFRSTDFSKLKAIASGKA